MFMFMSCYSDLFIVSPALILMFSSKPYLYPFEVTQLFVYFNHMFPFSHTWKIGLYVTLPTVFKYNSFPYLGLFYNLI